MSHMKDLAIKQMNDDEIAERDRLFDLADKHRCRVFDLLKASEGMEKALDSLVEHTIACEEQLDKFHGLGNDSGSGSSVCVLNAQSALADFRAVKENMEKGAGK